MAILIQSLAGCSGCEPSAISGNGIIAQPQSAGSEDEVNIPVSSRDERAKRPQKPPSLQALFQLVISRGFGKALVGGKRPDRERCRSVYADLLKRKGVLAFLMDKVNDGRGAERYLALWLIGELGSDARPAEHRLVNAIGRAWARRMKDCSLENAGDGQSKGVPAADMACVARQAAKTTPFDVMAACRALHRIGSELGQEPILKSGARGAFLKGCDGYFGAVFQKSLETSMPEMGFGPFCP